MERPKIPDCPARLSVEGGNLIVFITGLKRDGAFIRSRDIDGHQTKTIPVHPPKPILMTSCGLGFDFLILLEWGAGALDHQRAVRLALLIGLAVMTIAGQENHATDSIL